MKKILCLLCLLFSFLNMKAGAELYYTIAQNGLNMRNAPSDKAEVLTTIPYGAQVTMVENTNETNFEIYQININGMSCNWTKVKYKGQEGFVIDAYLLPWAAPKVGTESLEKYLKQISQAMGKPWTYQKVINGSDITAGMDYKSSRQLYQNGWFYATQNGFEYFGEEFLIPNININQAYCLLQVLSDFKVPFQYNTTLKVGNSSFKQSEGDDILWKVEAENYGGINYHNEIEIQWSDGANFSLQILSLSSGILISYSGGV